MNWQRHNLARHVLYAATQNGGVLMLHFYCEACRDTTQVRCNGYSGMPLFRLNEYANLHNHGRCPRINNPRPR